MATVVISTRETSVVQRRFTRGWRLSEFALAANTGDNARGPFDAYADHAGDAIVRSSSAAATRRTAASACCPLIRGHTDEQGCLQRRSVAPSRPAVVSKGIIRDRLTSTGFRETMPLQPGHNEEPWAKNRRVVPLTMLNIRIVRSRAAPCTS